MLEDTFQRARTEEKKRQRPAAILEAARSLAPERGGACVTLTAAANRAGSTHPSGASISLRAHSTADRYLCRVASHRLRETTA